MLDAWAECMRVLFAVFHILATLLLLLGMLASLLLIANWVVGRLLDWRVIIELAAEAKREGRSVWRHAVRANRWNGRA